MTKIILTDFKGKEREVNTTLCENTELLASLIETEKVEFYEKTPYDGYWDFIL